MSNVIPASQPATTLGLAQPPTANVVQGPYNLLHAAHFKGGWAGLFSGESQMKAMKRVVDDINAQGRGVAATVTDRWSFWTRLGRLLLAIVTLGFVVKHPDVIVVSAPIPR